VVLLVWAVSSARMLLALVLVLSEVADNSVAMVTSTLLVMAAVADDESFEAAAALLFSSRLIAASNIQPSGDVIIVFMVLRLGGQ